MWIAKESAAVLDYDDLLQFWHGDGPRSRRRSTDPAKIECVLVDEYQDTNILQAEILMGICGDGGGLTVVGDDAQSIYSFRAATVRNILDFPQEYPATTVVTLEQNYRSTQPLLDATNSVIAQASERHSKQLWSDREGSERPLLAHCQDEDEQTDYVIERVLEQRESRRGVETAGRAVSGESP